MARTITVTLYQYAELSDAAKAKARDWFRRVTASDDNYSDCPKRELLEACEALGFNDVSPQWSGFGNQGDGASFSADYRYSSAAAIRALKAEWPNESEIHAIADDLSSLQSKWFYCLQARIATTGNYCHEFSMDCHAWDKRNEQRDIGDASDAIRDLARRLAKWFYRALEAAYDDSISDETVSENIICNEYEFTAEGKRA